MASKTLKGFRTATDDNFQMPTDVKKVGYMKKLKTMKRKYFVLRDNNESGQGCLSYYDNEKKFRNQTSQPKRVIYLKDCFSINRKVNGKHDYAIALYTREDSFCTVVDDDQSLQDWLQAMVDLQLQCTDWRTGHSIQYEHVWQVTINRNGLGQTRNMNGTHRLCLTANTLYIVKVDPQVETPDVYEFPLISIRRCGHTSSTFFIELGRSSSIGPGDIWIQAEDSAVSQNMHEVILEAMRSSKNHDDFGPSQRPRSASTSDKPIINRRPTQSQSHTSQSVAPFGTSYLSTSSAAPIISQSCATAASKTSIRERCDSMPSRSRTTSETDTTATHDSRHWTPAHYQTTDRLHSGIHGRTLSYSPPSHNPLSASSAACSTDSAGSSLSIDDYESSHCMTIMSEHHSSLHNSLIPSEPPISEEDIQTDDYLSMSPTNSSGRQSSGFRSHLNLNFCPSNTSPITSPTMGSNKSVNQSIKEDINPYIPMSPVGSVEAESMASSRRSSGLDKHLNTETSSDYIPMMSSQEIKSMASEEYLNMAPLSESLPKMDTTSHHNSLSTMKEEFHLDKVKSYFSPSDQNDSLDYIPPVRAYSIGSRPQPQIHKPFMKKTSMSKQLLSKSGTQTPEEEEIRLRAFSMGSHSNTREMRVAAKKQALIEAQIGGPSAPIDELARHSKKASSAPILSPAQPRKRAATVGCRPVFNKTMLSTHPSDTDLMEIDYSKSIQSKQLKDRLEDRSKRPSIGHRPRSNSRSSTSSSGIGSGSTTSPSITSSMSELTDKKRNVTDDPNRGLHLAAKPDGNSEYLHVLVTNPETKLPTSHRPNTGQSTLQQISTTVPPFSSLHSTISVGLPQSHSKSLPTNQTQNITTKCESFAQQIPESGEELSIKTSKNKFKDDYNDSGDYVCLDMKSVTIVPQINKSMTKTSQVLSDDKSASIGSQQSAEKIDLVSTNHINTIPQNITYDTTAKCVATEQHSATADSHCDSTTGCIPNTDKQTVVNAKKSVDIQVNVIQNESIITTQPMDNASDNMSHSRRSSSGSERELNYASLDLAPAVSTCAPPPPPNADSTSDDCKSLSPHSAVKCGPQLTPITGTSTPLTAMGCGSQELLYQTGDTNPLLYAEIDFGIANKKITKS